MKRARAVIGANFGDEGKGLIVDHLCAEGAQVVVRYNGGANAGHTVITEDGERHVFRHFGSGSLREVPTFLSQFFVCNPILFFEELRQLRDLGFHPTVYAHPDCLITTFADMMINQEKERKRANQRHGSCGIGLHETIVRSKVSEIKITIGDLWNGVTRLERQLEEICEKYAKFRVGASIVETQASRAFLECCDLFADYVQPAGIGHFSDIVFEGAQGLLLDQNNKAFFPHVTHSNTGMQNIAILCSQIGIDDVLPYYVSRTYLTRHGAGLLPDEDPNLSYRDDTNVEGSWQGRLRFAPLDNGLLDRCAKDSSNYSTRKLVLTHCDQLAPTIEADLYASGPTHDDIKNCLLQELVR